MSHIKEMNVIFFGGMYYDDNCAIFPVLFMHNVELSRMMAIFCQSDLCNFQLHIFQVSNAILIRGCVMSDLTAMRWQIDSLKKLFTFHQNVTAQQL